MTSKTLLEWSNAVRRLVKTIESLEARVARLEAENAELRKELGKPVGKLSIFDKSFYVNRTKELN